MSFKSYLEISLTKLQPVSDVINRITGRTLIVFDTETTGVSRNDPWVQVTELAAIAIDPNTGKELGRFHEFAKLSPEAEQRIKRETADAAKKPERSMAIKTMLDRSGYKSGSKNEKDIIVEFEKFVGRFSNPLLVAHNAEFDMEKINGGLGHRIKAEVLDTLQLARLYLIPMLKELADKDKDIGHLLKKIISRFSNKKTIKSDLGTLGKMFGIVNKNWHSGIADVMQLAGIVSEITQFLKSAIGLTDEAMVRKLQAKAKKEWKGFRAWAAGGSKHDRHEGERSGWRDKTK